MVTETLTPASLLSALRMNGIAVSRKGERLRCEPGSKIPANLKETIRQQKADLLALLDQERWTTDPRPDLADDSPLWHRLLTAAYDHDGNDPAGLFGALHGLRCGGARLVREHGRLRLDPGDLGDDYPTLRQTYLTPRTETIRRLFTALDTEGWSR